MNEENKSGSRLEEKKNPAFHLFLYLVSFVSLGFVTAGILTIYFQVVNKVVKEPADIPGYLATGVFDADALKFGIASLAVAFVVYYVVLFLINRKLQRGEIDKNSLVRKFITYIALVAFAAMAVGSLVALLWNFLDGELTGKFLAKALIFLVVSGFFFGFYFWEIRREKLAGKLFRLLFVISVLLTLSALTAGFLVVDSPDVSRDKKIDLELVNNVSATDSAVRDFFADNKRLPVVEKNELRQEIGVEYKTVDAENFELCANFRQPLEEKNDFNREWNHPAGDVCFKRNALSEASGFHPSKIID